LDVSGCTNESRYQRVSWQVSDQGFYEDRDAITRLGRGMQSGLPNNYAASNLPGAVADAIVPEHDRDTMQVNLEGMNSEYQIDGDTELSPVMVLDDGKRTWLKFRNNLALRPALFAVSTDGQAETVEYVPRGAYFIVPKVFSHGMLLKLGKREVRIRNKSSSCSWFDTSCRKVTTDNILGGN
jgi:Conjugal transfer protein